MIIPKPNRPRIVAFLTAFAAACAVTAPVQALPAVRLSAFIHCLAAETDEVQRARAIRGIIAGYLGTTDGQKRQQFQEQLKAHPESEVVTAWLAWLEKTGSATEVRDIIRHLEIYTDRRIVIPVAVFLRHPHQPVRETAAAVLKKLGDDRLYPLILDLANSANPVHRIHFIEAMYFLYDRRFYNNLTGLARDSNKSVRIYAISCIYRNRISEAYNLLRNAAQADQNDEVRVAAIEALGNLRDTNAIGILQRTIGDQNRDVRSESVKAINKIGSGSLVFVISARLATETDEEIKVLLMDGLSQARKVGETRGLEKILLEDPSVTMRTRAAFTMGACADQRLVPALQRALQDPDYRMRAEVCHSLGFFRMKPVVVSLLEVCERDPMAYVRSAALYSLKKINDRSAIVPLFDLFSRERDPVFRDILRIVIREFIERYQ